MGFLSNCNFFTESDFDDYRRLDKVLNEADDDDLNDDESESNFDMPDDEDDQANNNDNTQQDTPPDNTQTQDDGGDDLNDDESESNFDMPDDDEDGDNPAPDAGEPATQSADNGVDTQSVQTQDAGAENELGDQEGESNFDLPDDDEAQGDQGGDNQTAGDDTTGGDAGGGDDLGDDESESNFDMDDETGDGGDPNGTDDGTGDDSSMDDMSGGTDPDQDLQDAENDIFNGLSDQDKVTKINELKDLYQDLYNRIVTLYDKVNDIPKEDDLIKVYNFIIDNLSDLKQFVYDYLSNTFENKTYLENMVNYKKYLSTLNVINGILEEIRKGLYKESGN